MGPRPPLSRLLPLAALLAGCGGGAEPGEPGPGGPQATGGPARAQATAGAERPARTARRPRGDAQLACAESTRDFGTVWRGTRLEHTFELVSEGPGDAVVYKIKPGCQCTVAEAWIAASDPETGEESRRPYSLGEPIPPGQRLLLETEYDTTGLVGHLPKSVTLYANLPGNALHLQLLADIQPWLLCEPDTLLFGRLSSVESRTAAARVTSALGVPFRLDYRRGRRSDVIQVQLLSLIHI